MLDLERSAKQVATTRRGEPELRERHGATAVPARASTA
jgi:hypothetical protein